MSVCTGAADIYRPGHDDLAYLQRRARRVREAASRCDDVAAVSIHLRLAREYERRIAAFQSR
jgi:hypothetical protein